MKKNKINFSVIINCFNGEKFIESCLLSLKDQTYKNSDVFVLSSYVEGLPNVLVEAMMCGCTPVSTDCPTGPREVLQDGKYGYLVPTHSPEELAYAVIKALESFKNPLKISTLSLTTFSFNTVEINVWSAPDKLRFTLDLVISVSSVWLDIPNIKSLAAYVTDEPDTDDVNGNEQSVILTGVPKLIVIRCTGRISFVANSFFTAVVRLLVIFLVSCLCYTFWTF